MRENGRLRAAARKSGLTAVGRARGQAKKGLPAAGRGVVARQGVSASGVSVAAARLLASVADRNDKDRMAAASTKVWEEGAGAGCSLTGEGGSLSKLGSFLRRSGWELLEILLLGFGHVGCHRNAWP